MLNIKIAISSDNHLDVNQVNNDQALTFQSNWLKGNKVNYYLFGGDLFNNFTKTERYFNELQELTPDTKIFYILGNHDMLNNISFDEIEHPRSPLYIHNRSIDIPNTNWRIIGNNGWYDYSFSTYANQPKKVQTWKKVYWLDSSIDQPIDDQERMKNVLEQVKVQLSSAQAARKKVIFLTHFAHGMNYQRLNRLRLTLPVRNVSTK